MPIEDVSAEAIRMISEIRELGVPLYEIAESVGLSLNSLRNIATGGTRSIRPQNMKAIRDYYQKTMGEGSTPVVAPPPVVAPSPSIPIPRNAREEYENFEFVGGKPEWLDLPDAERAYFETLYQRMELEIDEANADRDRRVERAVNELHKLVRDKMLGIR